MRALKKSREVSPRLTGSFESLLAQFSATTLELNPSLGTGEFSRRLTSRAAQMLGARAATLALGHENNWQIAALSGPAHRWDPITQNRLATLLAEQAEVPGSDLRRGSAAFLLGRGLAEALGWDELVVARLSGSEGELLGVLCIADLPGELSETERPLLEALAGHAAVAPLRQTAIGDVFHHVNCAQIVRRHIFYARSGYQKCSHSRFVDEFFVGQ